MTFKTNLNLILLIIITTYMYNSLNFVKNISGLNYEPYLFPICTYSDSWGLTFA